MIRILNKIQFQNFIHHPQYQDFLRSLPPFGYPLNTFMSSKGYFAYLSEINKNNLIGYLRFCPMGINSEGYFIRTVTIIPELRNQGYCKILMSDAMSELDELTQRKNIYSLNVRPQNFPAVSSYLKIGFELEKSFMKNNINYLRLTRSSHSLLT